MSVPAILANISFWELNITNCSNLALGLSIYQKSFSETVLKTDTSYYTQDAYYPVGRSEDWVAFWRAALGPNDQNFSNDNIVLWANDSQFTYFFADDIYQPQPDKLDKLATDLDSSGGCRSVDSAYQTLSYEYGPETLTEMVESCMLGYCCAPNRTDQQLQNNSTLFPFYPKWSVGDACAFKTCSAANHGNPDLGGIGIVIAYAIEAGLLGLACIIYAFGWIPRRIFRLFGKHPPRLLARHDLAVLMSSAVFLDSACYFALSVCFAGIIFNTRTPLLYEDKLGQTSTLLAINPPVSILLMTYTKLDRKNFRATLVLTAAVMTFIIQFLFRKAHSFDPSSSLCLDWNDLLQREFQNLFVIKAVWTGVVFLFIISHFIRWPHFRRTRHNITSYRPSKFERLKASRIGAKVYDISFQISWRQTIAVLLAVYGLIDCIFDIMFIQHLRKTESDIASVNQDKEWGYGQILALFIWVPVVMQYFYVLAFGRSGEWSRDEHDAERGVGKVHEYVMAPNAEKVVSGTTRRVHGDKYHK